MERMKMHTPSLADEKFAALTEMFPNAVTETICENGAVVRAIDKDVLMQEINTHVVEGREERYQFTWPDKRKSVLLANAPIAAALRPCREESVDFDTTENLYIEGDNLDVLKLLRETYLNRVKMIYIDPPYNTGNDFVYEDDFAEDAVEFLHRDGQYDEQGNRLAPNLNSNGRFHTDWLNMMYPRLRIARDLLSDDGIIFISIDDNEVAQLRKICDDIFGEGNFRNQITVRRGAKSVQAQFDTWDKLGQDVEHVLFYTKNVNYRFPQQRKKLDDKRQGTWNNHWRGTDRPTMRYELFGITPDSGQWRWGKERSLRAADNYLRMLDTLNCTEDAITQEKIDEFYLKQKDEDFILLRLSKNGKPEHYIPPTDTTLLNSSWYDLLVGSSSEISALFETKVFDTAKLTSIIKRMLNFCDKDALILDFFSGSATTAHAVMQLNAEEKQSLELSLESLDRNDPDYTTKFQVLSSKLSSVGRRKFIMVQIPEVCDEKSEAFKAGYKNICEIGKERIRRAGQKIVGDGLAHPENAGEASLAPTVKFATTLDIGFRVFKLDSSNMKDVYYTPEEFLSIADKQLTLDGFTDNIKADRTAEDLLFQVMLELGIPLSSELRTENLELSDTKLSGLSSKLYCVSNNYLIACFDRVDTELITEIAKKKPYYAVFRDSSFVSDSAMVNFEQVFNTYSPGTIRRVL